MLVYACARQEGWVSGDVVCGRVQHLVTCPKLLAGCERRDRLLRRDTGVEMWLCATSEKGIRRRLCVCRG